jgi:hypothetical protein
VHFDLLQKGDKLWGSREGVYFDLLSRHAQVDIGAEYFDQHKTQVVQNQLVKRLESLGLKVTLEPASTAA